MHSRSPDGLDREVALRPFDRLAEELEAEEVSVAPLQGGSGPIALARAPGRIDLLGGEGDFAGAMTLHWTTREECAVAVRAGSDRRITLVSEGLDPENQQERVEWSLDELRALEEGGQVRLLTIDPRKAWTALVVLSALKLEARTAGELSGLRVLVRSDLPRRAGLGSSTALIAAACRALSALLGVELDDESHSRLILEVESSLVPASASFAVGVQAAATALAVVGASAGVFLPIQAQPLADLLEVFDPIPPLDEIRVAAIRVPLSGPGTGPAQDRFRVAVAMAYRLIAVRMGLEVERTGAGHGRVAADPYYQGYLANIDPVLFAEEFRGMLPPRLMGEPFLDELGGFEDPAFGVDPATEYPVRAAAQFVIGENNRVCIFVDALHKALAEGGVARADLLGAQLNGSMREANALGLCSPAIEFLARDLQRRGAARGIHGVRASARDGVLVVLSNRGAESDRAVEESVAAFEREYGGTPQLLSGSSAGAGADESLRVLP